MELVSLGHPKHARKGMPHLTTNGSERQGRPAYHAIKKMTICLSSTATLMVFHTDPQAKAMYATHVLQVLLLEIVWRGGPGRSRSQIDAGRVKPSHQHPTMNRTRRRGIVDDTDSFDKPKSNSILRTCTKTAAAYPIPTPLEEIFVESLRAVESVCADQCVWLLSPLSSIPDDSLRRMPGDVGPDTSSGRPPRPPFTSGWFAARSGKKEFKMTKEEPRHVTPTTARTEPTRKISGTTNIKRAEEIPPATPKPTRNFFR